jgi:hypothetical protein
MIESSRSFPIGQKGRLGRRSTISIGGSSRDKHDFVHFSRVLKLSFSIISLVCSLISWYLPYFACYYLIKMVPF